MPEYEGTALVNRRITKVKIITKSVEGGSGGVPWGQFVVADCDVSGAEISASANSEDEALDKLKGGTYFIQIGKKISPEPDI